MAHIGNYLGSFILKGNDMKFVSWLLSRLKEPSTYAGFAGLALAFGLSDAEWVAVSTVAASLAGVIAVFLSEKPAPDA
jgi:hypothetical protein